MRGGHQRIRAQVHRVRAGVTGPAFYCHIKPGLPDNALYQTDRKVCILQNRALLNVKLQVGVAVFGTICRIPVVADPGQLIGKADAISVPGVEGNISIELAKRGARAEQRRSKARSFFTGPVHDLNWTGGLDVFIVECPHHFETGEHTKRTIVASAFGHGIEMRADDNGRQILRSGAFANNIAEVVDTGFQPSFIKPRTQQVARSAILIRKGEPMHSTIICSPNLPHRFKRPHEPVDVDLHNILIFQPDLFNTPLQHAIPSSGFCMPRRRFLAE